MVRSNRSKRLALWSFAAAIGLATLALVLLAAFPAEIMGHSPAMTAFLVTCAILLVASLALAIILFRQEHDLVDTEARLTCMFDQAAVGIAQVTVTGVFVDVNEAFAKLLGYRRADLIGTTFASHTHPEDVSRNLAELGALISGAQSSLVTEKRFLRADGGVVFVRITSNMLRPDGGSEPFLVSFAEDQSEARVLKEEIQRSSENDELTGLANRRNFVALLEEVIESNRRMNAQANLLIMDIDQFRVINDAEGHAAGDDYLRRLAQRLMGSLRTQDVVGRLDSDVFALLLQDCSRSDAERVAEKIRSEVETLRTHWGNHNYQFTASIGCVHLGPDFKGDATAALRDADAACVSAKSRGRNRVVMHDADDTMIRGWQGQVEHIQRLRNALETDTFELYAQSIEPIGDSGTRARHVEVLLRLRDEAGELIPTGEILRAAEQFHLAAKLDLWVVNHTLGWLEAHLSCLERISMCAINLSGQSLSDERALREISRLVRLGKVPPHKICFEVTETAAIANLVAAKHFIQRLKRVGCRFSLDDFGSGASSYGYLKELPVDFIKIDGAFVRNLCIDDSNEAIVRSIVTLARDLGKRTIAEMVEEEAVMSRLVDFGVDYAQGYFVSHPRPIAEVLAA